MPGHFPSLDPQALTRLRKLVQTMHQGNGRAVPMGELVQLANDVGLEAGVTVDFKASQDLGEPMVVLRVPTPNRSAECLKDLSRRELEVAELVSRGLSNKQIGAKLFISLPTVKDHVHHILKKTGLSNRAAVAAAVIGEHPPGGS